MIRIGLVGIGYLGSIHLELLLGLEQFELIGIFDRNPKKREACKAKYPHLLFFDTYAHLLSEVQAVGIIASTPAHFELALEAISAQKAVFIEKPLCQTLEESQALIAAQANLGLPFQVGHVERFNPAFIAFESLTEDQSIIQFNSTRCAPFQERGADVSVVLDLLIHDLDLLLSQTSSPLAAMEVEAQQVHTAHPDEVRAKLRFEDGLIADLFVSRLTDQRFRQLSIKTKRRFFELDLLNKSLKSTSINSNIGQFHTVPDSNALQQQWQDFAAAVLQKESPKVDLIAGFKALDLALRIDSEARAFLSQKKIETHNKKLH